MRFSNKVVVVTGSGSGIGREVALQFAKESASLSLVDKNADTLQETTDKCEAMRVKVLQTAMDLTNDEGVKKLIKNTLDEFGKIDVLVNCAGIIVSDDNVYSENILDNFDKLMSVNFRSVIAVTASAIPALIETKGCIINISSVYSIVGHKSYMAYSTSKASLNHFSRIVASELAPKGVRVNCILPGAVKTNILINNFQLSETESDEQFKSIEETVPLKKVVKVDEIAEAVLYLASDKAANITGINFSIDGGLFVHCA